MTSVADPAKLFGTALCSLQKSRRAAVVDKRVEVGNGLAFHTHRHFSDAGRSHALVLHGQPEGGRSKVRLERAGIDLKVRQRIGLDQLLVLVDQLQAMKIETKDTNSAAIGIAMSYQGMPSFRWWWTCGFSISTSIDGPPSLTPAWA